MATAKKERLKFKYQPRYNLLFMAIPFIILIILFNYLPIFGWSFAFFDYIPGVSLLDCDFVGFDYFKLMFNDTVNIVRVLKNTVIFALIGMAFSILPMLFAVMLNEVKCSPVKKLVQTFTTLPNFISMVIVFSLAFSIFSNDGLFNSILQSFGVTTTDKTSILGNSDAVYWFQSAIGLWKSLGWSSIIYLAAISGIDMELYDAAMVDGAGKFRCAWHITLPSISQTYFVLLIMSVGNFFNTGFEQYFLFKNPMTSTNIEVLDLYVYRIGLMMQDYSYGIAIGIVKSIISLCLLFFANNLAKRVRGAGII